MNAFLKPRRHPHIIAHRGASADCPENTLSAFREALRQKADAIELDVQHTADHQLIVWHDPWTQRTSNGKGLIKRKKLQELLKLDVGSWFNPRFKNEHPATLEHVLDEFGTTTNYVIELKFYQLFSKRFVRQVYQAVESRGLLDQVLFLSFDIRLLRAIKKYNPKSAVAWAFFPLAGLLPPKWLAAQCDVLALASDKADAHYIARLRHLGKLINIWTGAGRPENYQAEIGSGADFITTNHPRKLREAQNHAKQTAD